MTKYRKLRTLVYASFTTVVIVTAFPAMIIPGI